MSYRVNRAAGYQRWGVTNPWVWANYGQPQRQRGYVSPIVFQTQSPALRSAHLGDVTQDVAALLTRSDEELARARRMEKYAAIGRDRRHDQRRVCAHAVVAPVRQQEEAGGQPSSASEEAMSHSLADIKKMKARVDADLSLCKGQLDQVRGLLRDDDVVGAMHALRAAQGFLGHADGLYSALKILREDGGKRRAERIENYEIRVRAQSQAVLDWCFDAMDELR
jgi:hypothetical protein